MNKKGSILIVVLLIITALLSITLLRGEHVSAEYEKVTEMKNRLQGYIYCATTIKGITNLLADDSNYYDAPDEIWASLPPLPTPDGVVSASVIPLNSRIPLLSLTSKKEDLSNRVAKSFEKFESSIDIDRLMERLSEHTPYSIGELEFNRVFKSEDFNKDLLSRYTVENTGGKININFADPEVLTAFLPELEPYIDDILSYRESSPFKDISELRKVPGITDEIYLEVQPYITVKSSYFYVYTMSDVNGTISSAQAIVKRDKKRVAVVKYFEDTKDYYATK